MKLSEEQLDVLERAVNRRARALGRTRTDRATRERAVLKQLLLLAAADRQAIVRTRTARATRTQAIQTQCAPEPAAVASVPDSCNTVA